MSSPDQSGEEGATSGAPVRHEDPPPLARSALMTVSANLLLPLTSLATAPILAHTLGAQGRGEMAAVIMPLFVLTFVANAGLPEATAFAVARWRLDPSRVLKRTATLSVCYGTVGAVGLVLVAPYLLHKAPHVVPLLQMTAVALPFLMMTDVLRGTANGMRRYGVAAVERAAMAVSRLLLLVVLMLLGALTVATATVTHLATAGLGAVFLALQLARHRRRDAVYEPLPPRAGGKLASYGFRSWGTVLGNLVNWRLDQLFLVALVAPAQLGLYVVAVSFSELSSTAVNAVKNILFAEAAHRQDHALIARSSRVVLLLVSIAAVVGALLAEPVMLVLFGQEFRGATDPARVLLAAGVFYSAEQVLGAGLLAAGHPGRRSVGQLGAAVVTIVGLLTLVPVLGIMGAAVTSLMSYGTAYVIALWQLLRTHPDLRLRTLTLAGVGDLLWLRRQLSRILARGRMSRGAA